MTIRGKKSLRNAFFRALGPNAATFKAVFDAARQLLETSSMLVADIATACGFYDQSHFIHAPLLKSRKWTYGRPVSVVSRTGYFAVAAFV